MANTLLSVADLLLYLLLAANVGYLLLFALASKFSRPKKYPHVQQLHRFAVLFPAYGEDGVIVQAVQSFLKQDYPKEKYDLIVISDHMLDATNEALRALPIRLLVATYTESSKAKAMTLAMEATAGEAYNKVVIMDADNTTSPQFLTELNRASVAGLKAIQAHRVAKNLNTSVAILDAVSEEINNSIFRSGHIVLGLSSALIGSGMALDADWFRQNVTRLQTAGEDKELEALLLKERIHIGYLEHVRVEDEKTQKKSAIKNQRKRWIAAQFGSLRAALPHWPEALRKGNLDYVDKVLQWALPPRIVLLAGVFFLSTIATLIHPLASVKWWILSGTLIATLTIAIPRSLMNRQLLKALLQVPPLALMMIANLFKLKGVNKRFIHTAHGQQQ